MLRSKMQCKEEVHIGRGCRSTEGGGGGATCNSNNLFDAENRRHARTVQEEDVDLLGINSHHEKNKSRLKSKSMHPAYQSDQSSDNIVYNVPEDIAASESVLSFNNVKAFEDFKIYVNGQIIDSEIPEPLKMKYYELCCSQKMFLHEHVIKGLSGSLVAGVILEIIHITDTIKSGGLSVSLRNLELWDRTLNSFMDLGMAVGFLCDRIRKLVEIMHDQEATAESKRRKLVQMEDERTALREKVVKLDKMVKNVTAHKSRVNYLDAEVDSLIEKNKKLDILFKEVAASAW